MKLLHDDNFNAIVSAVNYVCLSIKHASEHENIYFRTQANRINQCSMLEELINVLKKLLGNVFGNYGQLINIFM